MGNYNFKASNLPAGTIVRIKHDDYSNDQEIPDNLMNINNKVRIIETKNLFKSRPTAPDVTVSKVQKADGTLEAVFTCNLGK